MYIFLVFLENVRNLLSSVRPKLSVFSHHKCLRYLWTECVSCSAASASERIPNRMFLFANFSGSFVCGCNVFFPFTFDVGSIEICLRGVFY
jgi:hypothetical protein